MAGPSEVVWCDTSLDGTITHTAESTRRVYTDRKGKRYVKSYWIGGGECRHYLDEHNHFVVIVRSIETSKLPLVLTPEEAKKHV